MGLAYSAAKEGDGVWGCRGWEWRWELGMSISRRHLVVSHLSVNIYYENIRLRIYISWPSLSGGKKK